MSVDVNEIVESGVHRDTDSGALQHTLSEGLTLYCTACLRANTVRGERAKAAQQAAAAQEAPLPPDVLAQLREEFNKLLQTIMAGPTAPPDVEPVSEPIVVPTPEEQQNLNEGPPPDPSNAAEQAHELPPGAKFQLIITYNPTLGSASITTEMFTGDAYGEVGTHEVVGVLTLVQEQVIRAARGES